MEDIEHRLSDFTQTPNIALQYVAEKKMSAYDYLLYNHYLSVHNVKVIPHRYAFIAANAGVSKAQVTRSNKVLEDLGLILVEFEGKKMTVTVTPIYKLPKRDLIWGTEISTRRNIDAVAPSVNVVKRFAGAASENKENFDYSFKDIRDMETRTRKVRAYWLFQELKAYPKDKIDFINNFVERYEQETGNKYNKNDLYKAILISDCKNAQKYFDTFWKIKDKTKGDQSISWFFHLFTHQTLIREFSGSIQEALALGDKIIKGESYDD